MAKEVVVFALSRIMAQLASMVPSLFNSKPTGLADTPEGCLNLAKKCMERVQKMASPSASKLKFNHGQCRYLVMKLNLAIENAGNILGIPSRHRNRLQVLPQNDMVDCCEVFKLLYALAIKVQNIVQSCCRDKWTLAAVTLADVSEHISSVGFDLELWRVTFCAGVSSADIDSIFQDEVEAVKFEASIDRKTLLKDISALLQRKRLSSTEHERASLLLERLERSGLTPSGDSAGSSRSSRSEKVIRNLKQMESLGKGSAGTVYKAAWLGAEFAKKTFYGPNFPDFEKEVSILIGLSHPNITPLISYAKDKRECSIVMELMDGDLFSLMQSRLKVNGAGVPPFGILEAVDIMHQLGEGMYYLHEMKIVHRDLKSMNVLVKLVKASESEVEHVQIKVADFGMSRTKERSMTYSNQTVNVGTTRWMAPEAIRCLDFESLVDGEDLVVQYPFKCDIYSFGMVCYEVLSGDIPFTGISSPTEVKKKVLNGEHPELRDIQCPELLKDLIKRCWSLDPSQRPKFGDICGELRRLKFLLLSSALITIAPPESLQARASSSTGSKTRQVGDWLVGWGFGSRTTPRGVNVLRMDPSSQVAKRLSLAEITAATQNFNREIGQGGFGPVYYGKLPSGKEVAVKVSDANSHQGFDEFYNEVQLLSRVHHKNVVSLLGYCQDGKHQMLVYEYLSRGTVREHLYSSPLATEEPLDWKTRLDIALNSAQGLEYLHSGCTPPIIHRDVKSSNILLTDKYMAKVADFGLSRLGPKEGGPASYVSTAVKGTVGYLDPEYLTTGNLTERADVFSFGVVLLELLCGRPPIDLTLADEGDGNLTDKVRRSLQAGDIGSVLDPAMKQCNPNIDSVWKVAEIAIQSVEPKGVHRPLMHDVVKELREAIELESGHSGVSTDYSNASSAQFAAPRLGTESQSFVGFRRPAPPETFGRPARPTMDWAAHSRHQARPPTAVPCAAGTEQLAGPSPSRAAGGFSGAAPLALAPLALVSVLAGVTLPLLSPHSPSLLSVLCLCPMAFALLLCVRHFLLFE